MLQKLITFLLKVSIETVSAFDMVDDPIMALETLVSLGFQRVLTSGCDSSALEGLPLIKRIIDQVCIMKTGLFLIESEFNSISPFIMSTP